jgi:hypothetical protein
VTSENPYPDGAPVLVRYPRTPEQEKAGRESWPWLPGSVLEQCGPDEWRICVEVRELTVREDGSKPRRNTPPHKLFYPCCFPGSSEIRRAHREP